jgi:hypothetical protein
MSLNLIANYGSSSESDSEDRDNSLDNNDVKSNYTSNELKSSQAQNTKVTLSNPRTSLLSLDDLLSGKNTQPISTFSNVSTSNKRDIYVAPTINKRKNDEEAEDANEDDSVSPSKNTSKMQRLLPPQLSRPNIITEDYKSWNNKSKNKDEKLTHSQREKKKRDLGQSSRGKSYVEEEKRILRESGGN